jgi:hypothetical protein
VSQTIQAQIKGNDCENGDDPWKQGSHKNSDQILAEYLERQKARREAKYKHLSPDYIREHIILDECQAVKSIKSRQHQSISQLPRKFLVGLTATPMWNQAVDLFSYFSLLAGNLSIREFDEIPRPEDVACDTVGGLYTAWSQVNVLPPDSTAIPYELLSPGMLLQLVPKGKISAAMSHQYFPFLFRAAIMMRPRCDTVPQTRKVWHPGPAAGQRYQGQEVIQCPGRTKYEDAIYDRHAAALSSRVQPAPR